MMRQNAREISEKKNEHESRTVFVLYRELERGIQSMKQGNVYTVEEAWREIDSI